MPPPHEIREFQRKQAIENIKKTIADCDNGIALLDNCLFSGIMAERIARHKAWLETMKVGIQRELFKIQDAPQGVKS